jgi:hypothetical protein
MRSRSAPQRGSCAAKAQSSAPGTTQPRSTRTL